MTRGETTTIKPTNDTIAARTVQKIVMRHATPSDLAQAKQAHIGTTFALEVGDVYRVTDVILDDLSRLIIIGQLER